jgi:putative RNA 2'-phosphotransferase
MAVPYEFDAERFSRWMAYVLRHNPGRYGLQHDRHGFVSLELFEQIARRRYPQVEPGTLRELIAGAGQRFELAEHRLRARYGHSIPVDPAGAPMEPPPQLYYGLDGGQVEGMLREGLHPIERCLLHLSTTPEEARAVASRKSPQPALLCVDAQAAHRAGVLFYQEGPLYLTLAIPASFLRIEPA